MILHAQPALYTLDGLTGVKNPIGLHADRLGVDPGAQTPDPRLLAWAEGSDSYRVQTVTA